MKPFLTLVTALCLSLSPGFAADQTLQDKTLVAWLCLRTLQQPGAAAISLMDGEDFDAIVIGERQPGRWMAGSDFFRRTQPAEDQTRNVPESAGSNTLVMVAAVYEGVQIRLYRNGELYATYQSEKPRSFPSTANVLLGLRYSGQMGEIGFLDGEIEEARAFDRALTAQQIAALKPNQQGEPAPLGWWTFENGSLLDHTGHFRASRLEGTAALRDGRLCLNGQGYLRAARDASCFPVDPASETSFDNRPQTLFYKARSRATGNLWDTWLFQHEGEYFLYYLARCRAQWDNISMARSTDGIHWTELGRILSKGPGVTWMGTGSTWKSPGFERDRKFQMNFSEWKGPRQTIFFADSTNLVNWTRLGQEYEFVQDERWYEREGRWDCIWTLPRAGGGLYGYWTATPKSETGGRFGFGFSLDGVRWQALPPPKVAGVGEGEVGAIEKIGNTYYLLFGTGGYMTTLRSEQPEGPFVATTKNPRLLAGHTYFARFFPSSSGLLVNHHSIARDGEVYFGTLKSTRVDESGTLRLGWWPKNKQLKSRRIPFDFPPFSASAARPRFASFSASAGLIVEGRLKLPSPRTIADIGFILGCAEDSGAAVLLRGDGVAQFGAVHLDGTNFKIEHEVDRQMDWGDQPRFRLLVKGPLLEFYLNDVLINCYSLPQPWSGKVGFLNGSGTATLRSVRAWLCEP